MSFRHTPSASASGRLTWRPFIAGRVPTSAARRGASVFKVRDVSLHRSIDVLRAYVRDADLLRSRGRRSIVAVRPKPPERHSGSRLPFPGIWGRSRVDRERRDVVQARLPFRCSTKTSTCWAASFKSSESNPFPAAISRDNHRPCVEFRCVFSPANRSLGVMSSTAQIRSSVAKSGTRDPRT
jgi:hypothetical protein